MKVQIMAIGNVTPDSFYAPSRIAEDIVRWADSSLSSGADILDIGGCSTRPGCKPVGEEEEWRRVEEALSSLRKLFPEAQLSLDTFRASVARRALDYFGPLTINDVSGGDEEMYRVVREAGVPYVWTLRGNLELPSRQAMAGIRLILDPGFGFIGSTEGDYACLRRMALLKQYGHPILVGVSRKSMIYNPLGITPEESMSATQVVQLVALQHGATILRTHDVKATAQTIKLWELTGGEKG